LGPLVQHVVQGMEDKFELAAAVAAWNARTADESQHVRRGRLPGGRVSYTILLKAGLMQRFFRPVVERVVGLMLRLLRELGECHAVVCVGGFGESLVLQRALGEALQANGYGNTQLKTAQEHRLTIARGEWRGRMLPMPCLPHPASLPTALGPSLLTHHVCVPLAPLQAPCCTR
jgi:hypothetical protein